MFILQSVFYSIYHHSGVVHIGRFSVLFYLLKKKVVRRCLTEVAGEGGPDLAPQKFLSSQKFRHLMG